MYYYLEHNKSLKHNILGSFAHVNNNIFCEIESNGLNKPHNLQDHPAHYAPATENT